MRERFKKFYLAHTHLVWACGIGFIFFFIYYLPFFVLGESSYFMIWDNLDSEIVANQLAAKYFFKYSGTITELMNLDVRAINSFNLIQIPLYAVLPGVWAYVINDLIVRIFAFIGMYLFMNRYFRGGRRYITLTVAVVFAAIPFFSAYGLTVAGIPLLAWAFWKLFDYGNSKNAECRWRDIVPSFLAIAFFTISSSLFLSGYFILAFLFIACVFFLCKKKYRRQQMYFYIGAGLMLVLYLLVNLKMILLMLNGYQSHRDIWNYNPDQQLVNTANTNFFEFVRDIGLFFAFGHAHSMSRHAAAVILCIAVFIYGLVMYIRNKKDFAFYGQWAMLWKIIAGVFLTSVLASFLGTHWFAHIAAPLKLMSFTFTRLYHAIPFLWIWGAGISILIIMEHIKTINKVFIRRLLICCTVFALCIVPHTFMLHRREPMPLFTNYGKMFGVPLSDTPNYKEFFDKRLFSEIDEYIIDEYDMTKDEYRVGTIAGYPTIAVYNGFLTVDGYVQNYSLEYWDRFRKVIAGELNKDKALDDIYKWGNRCYLFSNEIGGFRRSPWISKHDDIVIENLSYGTDGITAFKNDLGGTFIFSYVEIENYAENGLEVCNGGEPFVGSFWQIYLYRAL